MSRHPSNPALLVAGLAFVVLTAPPARGQDWKGQGRLQGSLKDPDGKPITDATVKANCPERGGTTVKTDKKGRWVLGGIVGCTWELDMEAPGFVMKKISVPLPSEEARMPSVDVTLERSAAPGPDLKDVAETAEAAYKAGRYDEARAEFEKLLAARPDLAPTIYQRIGFSYVQQKQYDKALAALQKALEADPANAQVRAIAAQAALEGGMVDKARELLSGLDESKITDPDVFFNMGINYFNAGQVDDAIAYFAKTIARDPAYVDAYYRRGLAYLGQGKTAEAKTDFQKVVELQPDSDMGKMAKKALDQIK